MRAVSIFNVIVTTVGAMGAMGLGLVDRRALRPGGVCGQPPDARDRHPHGDRRQRVERAADGAPSRTHARADRAGPRARRERRRRRVVERGVSIGRRSARPHVAVSHRTSRVDRDAAGCLHSGGARVASQSGRGASLRVTERRAPAVNHAKRFCILTTKGTGSTSLMDALAAWDDDRTGKLVRRFRQSVVSSNWKPCSPAASNSAPSERVPALGLCGVDPMPGQRADRPPGRAVVKEDEHWPGTGLTRRLSATKSSTAVICSRVTSHCSMTSSMLRSYSLGGRQASSLEHLGAADLARNALDGCALGPLKNCPWRLLCPDLRQKATAVHGVTPPRERQTGIEPQPTSGQALLD